MGEPLAYRIDMREIPGSIPDKAGNFSVVLTRSCSSRKEVAAFPRVCGPGERKEEDRITLEGCKA